MRSVHAALLLLSLVPLSASAQTFGLGVGASSPDSVDLRVDGKVKTFHVAAEAPTPATQAFLNCLVAGRVVQIEAGGKKLAMLDKSDVAMLLHEFSQSKTTVDPCTLGKAAYKPAHSTAAVPAAAPSAAPAAPSTAATATQPKKHLGRTAAPAAAPEDDRMKTLGTAFAPSTSSKGTATSAAQPAPAGEGLNVQSLPSAPVETAQPASAERTLGTAAQSPTMTPGYTQNPQTGAPNNPATTTAPTNPTTARPPV